MVHPKVSRALQSLRNSIRPCPRRRGTASALPSMRAPGRVEREVPQATLRCAGPQAELSAPVRREPGRHCDPAEMHRLRGKGWGLGGCGAVRPSPFRTVVTNHKCRYCGMIFARSFRHLIAEPDEAQQNARTMLPTAAKTKNKMNANNMGSAPIRREPTRSHNVNAKREAPLIHQQGNNRAMLNAPVHHCRVSHGRRAFISSNHCHASASPLTRSCASAT